MKHRILWAAIHAGLAAQGVFAQTINNDSASTANSGSVSGATAVSSPTVNVTPTVNNNTAAGSTSHSGAVSGSVATGGQGGAGGAGGVANVSSTPTATSSANSSTASRSDASNAGNTQVIQFNTTAAPAEAVQRQVISGGTNSTVTTNGTTTQNQNQVLRMEGGTTSTVRSEGHTVQDQNVNYHISGEQTQRIEYSGTHTVKNVPSVNGPPLTTSNDTCMGSTSGSVNGPGFGIGLGTTWQDKNCVMLKNARELWNMGMKAASLALICMDDSNRTALEITGFVCPQTAARQRAEAETVRIASEASERERLKRRVAELEAQRRRPTAGGWLRPAGEVGTPLPPPVIETAIAIPAVVAKPASVQPVAAQPVAAQPVAAAAQPAAETSAVREPAPVRSSPVIDPRSGAEIVRVLSEPAR